MAGLAKQLLPAALAIIVVFPLHATVDTPRIPSARVLISPATTNQNLEFQGDSERFFHTTSLGGEFLQHPAFGAVFKKQTPHDAWPVSDEEEGKFPGRIVALSYDSTAAEVEGKGLEATSKNLGADRRDFALKSAPEGLVSTIMTAYNRHCNLVISPDEVWLTILAQFCVYVNRNAEELRSRIVAHEGQIELRAYGPGTLETADYRCMIRDLLGEIRKNIKSPELADWFRPGFSTTTERDEVCAAATAMSSLQSYFTYEFVLTCGIPSVTLMGTVADWKLLREKIDRLLEFEVKNNPEGNVMEIWVGYLRKVSEGLIESAEQPSSAKTLEFWDKVLSHKGGGSGPSYISGWVTAFTCFDKDGKFIGKRSDMRGVYTEFPMIESNDISHNVVSCPVKIDDNGKEYDGTLFTGQVVFEAERSEKDAYPTIRPRNDWCMAVAVK